MGCGKTAVARILAAETNRQMVDLDELITQQEGRTPAQIISEKGESEFRSIENRLLSELLSGGFSGVLSLGGGAWIESANRELLDDNDALTIWLDTAFDVCWERIESAEEIRPLAPTKDQARALFERRRPVYELADIHINSSNDESLSSLALRVKGTIQKSDTL
jgi:shikimate kinase